MALCEGRPSPGLNQQSPFYLVYIWESSKILISFLFQRVTLVFGYVSCLYFYFLNIDAPFSMYSLFCLLEKLEKLT